MVVNAIDFSDLTKKPKPQGFQTPPPQPPQTQLGIKNPKTGEVEPAMGYPVNQMGQGDELLQLFPIPVMICPCLLYTSPSPRDKRQSRMPSSA